MLIIQVSLHQKKKRFLNNFMKKILVISFLSFLLLISPVKSGGIGQGELKLSQQMVDWFIKYVKLSGGKKPSVFLVTTDGVTGIYWQCPHGTCRPGSHTQEIKDCERRFNRKCAIFAKRRTVKWKNGINKGNKESVFKSKWSETQIKEKLTELGFLGNKTQKIEKKEASQTKGDGDITKQLTNLIEMYESGTVTEEEFKKAKKKLLD